MEGRSFEYTQETAVSGAPMPDVTSAAEVAEGE